MVVELVKEYYVRISHGSLISTTKWIFVDHSELITLSLGHHLKSSMVK